MGKSIKKRKTLKGGPNKPASRAKLGSGGRFNALKNKIAREPGVTNPGAVAAAIGRRKYGNKKFQSLAAHGKKH